MQAHSAVRPNPQQVVASNGSLHRFESVAQALQISASQRGSSACDQLAPWFDNHEQEVGFRRSCALD